MSAKILKGSALSAKLLGDLRQRANAVSQGRGSPPHLAILSLGGDASSQLFLRKKLESCQGAGIECTVEALPDDVSEAEVLRILRKLGQDPTVDGVIVDLPVPGHLDARRLAEAVAPDKDVEGISAANLGRFYSEKSFESLKESDVLIPCTAIAVISLLLDTGIEPRGKFAVVVGRSNIVGKPVAHLLSCLDATVLHAHSRTEGLEKHLREADILVVAAGKPRFIRGEWIKPGAIVLDVGMNKESGGLCGDVDFESARQIAGFITPVPGGIGPLTVTFLLYNTVISAERRARRYSR